MLRLSGNTAFIGLVSLQPQKPEQEGYLGTMEQINEIIEIYRINEVIFCADNMSSHDIISHMSMLQNKQVHFKIAPPESLYIIGSNSIDTFGDLFTINVNGINLPANKRHKRLFDLTLAMLMLVTFPLHVLFQKHRWGFIKNLFKVIFSRLSYVGYHPAPGVDKLPEIRKSILHPGDAIKNKDLPEETKENLNNLYAKDYKIESDLQIMIKGYRLLGRQS